MYFSYNLLSIIVIKNVLRHHHIWSDKWYHMSRIICIWWEWRLQWLWVAFFQVTQYNNSRSNDAQFVQILCFFFMPSTDWCERKQPTSHQKFHWVIRIGFDSFLLKQKADVDIPLAEAKASLIIKINIVWFLFCDSYYSILFLLFDFLFYTFLWRTILFW